MRLSWRLPYFYLQKTKIIVRLTLDETNYKGCEFYGTL